jgi:hypothetical protein
MRRWFHKRWQKRRRVIAAAFLCSGSNPSRRSLAYLGRLNTIRHGPFSLTFPKPTTSDTQITDADTSEAGDVWAVIKRHPSGGVAANGFGPQFDGRRGVALYHH